MRFVDVNPYFYPFKGGIENRMHDTARLLAERGHDVTILTGRLPDTPEEERTPEGYRIIRLKSKLLNIYNPPYISSEGVLEALNGLDADAVNYNYRWAPSYNKDLARYDGYKVFTYHNMWGEGAGIQARFSEINDNSFRKTLMTFDHIVCVSDYVRNDLIRRGIPADMTTTIPTGFTCKPLEPMEEGDFILSLGRQVKTKGLKYMVEAMKDVDCKLIVCGKGPESKNLEKQVKRLGLEDRVELRGYVSEEEKSRLMGSCRFFGMPSLFESFGLAAVELMSHGRPLVCTNVNGLPETVGDGAITVDPADPKALADAMNRLLKDEGLRKDLGLKARARAEYYSWDRFMDTYESILLRGKNGSARADATRLTLYTDDNRRPRDRP